MATLHLVRGIPGSGKSSFVRKTFPGILHIENDMFHMHDGKYDWRSEHMKDAISWCAEMVETALANSMDVVVANTFTKKKFIEFYKKLADEYHAKFNVYRCIGNFKNVHGLTNSTVKNFEDNMEDWPGETIVQPQEIKQMKYEVFNLMNGQIYGEFSDMYLADRFIVGLGNDTAQEVQIRQKQNVIE